MNPSLLVTLADKNYIDQAKQLFSSVYFNAGWQGDYMLLAHDIPDKDLQWFLDKGILVKKCKPLFDKDFGYFKNKRPVMLDKFYLFTPEFKKWKNIVYLDTDIIVRKSLEGLTDISGFAAVRGGFIAEEFDFANDFFMEKDLSNRYNLWRENFNSGVIAFSTDIIKEHTFDDLLGLFHKYFSVHKNADEPTLNLFFYDKWQKLSFIYNFNPYVIISDLVSSNEVCSLPVAVLHFFVYDIPNKPWFLKSIFYNEWRENLEKANNINLKEALSVNRITEDEVKDYSAYIEERLAVYSQLKKLNKIAVFVRNLDKSIGQYGLYLKSKYPRLYSLIKKIKK